MPEPAALLSVSNLETSYGPILALRGVRLEVAHGLIVTVLGANGAGKTTIRKLSPAFWIPRRAPSCSSSDIPRMPPDQVVRLGFATSPKGAKFFRS